MENTFTSSVHTSKRHTSKFVENDEGKLQGIQGKLLQVIDTMYCCPKVFLLLKDNITKPFSTKFSPQKR